MNVIRALGSFQRQVTEPRERWESRHDEALWYIAQQRSAKQSAPQKHLS